MKRFVLLALALGIACAPQKSEKEQLAEQVKQEFLHAWNGYKQHAWGDDALKPLSKSSKNWYDASLLMTPVDAFDTMLLMGLDEEAAEAKELIFSELSFDHDFFVSNFEITIRLLGGLLSAYEMDGDERFLELAEDLGRRLLPAFDSATEMTYGRVNLKTGETEWQVNNPAEIGTLMIEFGTLTKHTQDSVFYNSAKKAMMGLYERRSEIGLVGTTIDVETGEWQNKEAHISGMIDSYYEYALKSWLLFGDKDFRKIWKAHEPALEKYLLDEVATGTWYGRANMDTGERTATTYGALDAFMPGVLVLAGDIETAKKVQESNFKMWQLHGIEPEGLNYVDMEVTWAGYPLRPENIESAYYLYQATGDEKYIEMGKVMFQSLIEYCKTEHGYAALSDVTTKEKSDDMESFFLAETLKYAYLLFADDEVFDLDKHVFNTEAHPMRID
ncbi:MAG: glycoside hydrolase family 47 protein [Balneola sp.]